MTARLVLMWPNVTALVQITSTRVTGTHPRVTESRARRGTLASIAVIKARCNDWSRRIMSASGRPVVMGDVRCVVRVRYSRVPEPITHTYIPPSQRIEECKLGANHHKKPKKKDL
ncbi:hypothetical protein B0F90DRAFT_848579 [Multifurca ochricompacta]|uniref:Uncharacterized protein n=1 Tax=Multifurca ochricompacta TaxID=376703 RepID=A0AAD4QM66_9AGAM|nr:hypothetical protein B0F90DRAFT_848579 [Multifurca ochricompacta]